MEKPEITQRKTSWWLATKVTWSLSWRYIVYALLPMIVVALVAGFSLGVAMGLSGITNLEKYDWVFTFMGVVISLVGIVNYVRIMLNKGEFKSFTFIPKE